MTLAYDVRRPITIVGFPLSAWAFALRIWAAILVGLYAAFWLQLESASSAAITVGILALQTRGQVYQKAAYRVLATIIGVVASLAGLQESGISTASTGESRPDANVRKSRAGRS